MKNLQTELLKELLVHLFMNGNLSINISGLEEDTVAEIIEGKCYQALQRIKAIVADDHLQDADCFAKIEEIVGTLEEIGSNGGGRHDFG